MMHSLCVLPPEVAIAPPPQATSDQGMIALWLGNYRSANTRGAYTTDVHAFIRLVAMPLAAVTLGDVQGFAASIGHMAPATVSRRLSAVKSLIALGHRLGYLPFDVAAPVQLPAIEDGLAQKILTEWQVLRMLELERNRRNAALLRLLYIAGLRVSEICGLRLKDLVERNEGGQISVFGKGGKTRVILLPAPIWTRVAALQRSVDPDAPVFRSRQGGALNRSQVHRIVKAAAKRAKLSALVSAHWLRHSHASHALDRGAPVHVVQTTLGHASLSTTTCYSHARPGDSSARYLTA
jgi:integrase/recombinase XerD